jgi:hypothetical protein
MHDETKARMQTIQTAVDAAKARLEDLKAKLSHNKDENINDRLRRAAHPFADVEMFFRQVEEKRMPGNRSRVKRGRRGV